MGQLNISNKEYFNNIVHARILLRNCRHHWNGNMIHHTAVGREKLNQSEAIAALSEARLCLSLKEQVFLVLLRLRQGFLEMHLDHLFGIIQANASRIFAVWINHLYLRFWAACNHAHTSSGEEGTPVCNLLTCFWQ